MIARPSASASSPARLPPLRTASRLPDLRTAQSSRGSWLPATIGGGADGAPAAGSACSASQRASDAREDPFATDLRGGDPAGTGQRIEGTLRKPQPEGGFRQGQVVRHARQIPANAARHARSNALTPSARSRRVPSEENRVSDLSLARRRADARRDGRRGAQPHHPAVTQVSISAVLVAALGGLPLGALAGRRALPGAARHHHRAERLDGPAPGGGRAGHLPAALALRAARQPWAALPPGASR